MNLWTIKRTHLAFRLVRGMLSSELGWRYHWLVRNAHIHTFCLGMDRSIVHGLKRTDVLLPKNDGWFIRSFVLVRNASKDDSLSIHRWMLTPCERWYYRYRGIGSCRSHTNRYKTDAPKIGLRLQTHLGKWAQSSNESTLHVCMKHQASPVTAMHCWFPFTFLLQKFKMLRPYARSSIPVCNCPFDDGSLWLVSLLSWIDDMG